MPTLNWIGKEKVVNHHQDVPYRILEHSYGFSAEKGKQDNPTNSGNKIIHGDNLEALKSLLPEYEAKIKCIYIDPPYNTGNENWVYNDNVNHPKIKKWLGEVVGKQGEDLTRHDKWLCMMYPRLVLLHKLLSDDGAIFISIDDNEQASLKLMLDEIFGNSYFVGVITWIKRTKPINSGKARFQLQQKAEYVLCYIKQNKNYFKGFNLQTKGERKYPYKDDFDYYRLVDIEDSDFGEKSRDTMKFSILGITPPIGKRWKIGELEVNNLIQSNRIINIEGKIKKVIYACDEGSDILKPFWSHFEEKETGTAETGKALLARILETKNHDFDTVKPVGLIEQIVYAIADKNSIILDSFAGSGTTAHAVLNLNKQDGGNRKFILIEMEDYAETITAERVKRVIKGYGEGKNAVEGTGGNFDFYELGLPIFKDDKNLNEEVGEQKIREYIYYTETKQHLTRIQQPETKYLLDTYNETGYYFYYEKERLTVLNSETLNIVKERAGQYLIYADVCSLDSNYMLKNNIIFQKIPRDIKRF